MGNEQAVMAEFAENLWRNFIRQKHDEVNMNNVSFYMASVVTNPGDGTLTVQEPFDNPRTVTCATSLATIAVGSKVLVLRLGNGSNAANHLAIMNGNADPILAETIVRRSTSETDADNIRATGWYYFTSAEVANMSNVPVSGDGMLMWVFKQSDVLGFQFARRLSSNAQDLWMRSRMSAGWGDWKMIGRENNSLTWVAPSPYSSRCTVADGGYSQTGKLVKVSMQLTSAYTRTQTTIATVQICSSFPLSERISPLNCYNHTKGILMPCYVNNLGALNLRLGAVTIASGDDLYISGEYYAS